MSSKNNRERELKTSHMINCCGMILCLLVNYLFAAIYRSLHWEVVRKIDLPAFGGGYTKPCILSLKRRMAKPNNTCLPAKVFLFQVQTILVFTTNSPPIRKIPFREKGQ